MTQLWNDSEGPDDEGDIRYSLTALGEAVLESGDAEATAFRGFGPCITARDSGAEPVAPCESRSRRQAAALRFSI